MPLTRSDDVLKVELSTPGEWAELRRRISAGEERRIAAAAVASQRLLDGTAAVADMEQIMLHLAFVGLEIGVVRWSFEEPVTPENLRRLDPTDFDVLSERCNELWKPREAEEKNG